MCSRGAATLLTYTPFNNLSSSEREEKMRGDSNGSKYSGGNKDEWEKTNEIQN